jgi:glucan phosphoethanolaminetransferase (alkaline phosphatase superfamily)
MVIDIVVFGIPVLFGLLVMWRGVRRSLLSLPVRVLFALLAAWLMSSAVSIYLVVEAQSFLDAISHRSHLPTAIALAVISWLVFSIVLLAVLIVLSRIRTRVLQNAEYSVGIAPSVSRFAVGAACGLLLVLCFAVPTLLYAEALLPDQLSTESQGSISFPMLKRISDRTRTWLQESLPPSSVSPAAPAGP